MPRYVELQVTSHFSFLRGVSSPEELFAAAGLLGYRRSASPTATASAAWCAAGDGQKTTGVRLIAGCRLDLIDGRALLVWPEDRAAWSRLTRLL